jgi:hypothetical protein
MTKVLLSLQLVTITGLVLLIVFGGNPKTDPDSTVDPRPAKAEFVGFQALRSEIDALRRSMAAVQEKNGEILEAMEWLAIDVDNIKRNTWETMMSLQAEGGAPEPEAPESYRKLFDPETREALVKAAAKKGVRLTDDRVSVGGVIVQQRAALEFFAVTTGGKIHESVVAVTGNFDPEREGVPEGLAGMINACILALGYEKGTPVRTSRDRKVLPPQGMPINVYIEWKGEDGETVRARAEDLVYNAKTRKQMERGKWVYVGSRFERDHGTDKTNYLADLTGDLVATYSWVTTVVDNTTSEGSDDTNYYCYTPRIPEIGTKVDLVFSKKELAAKEFPEGDMAEEDDGEGDSGK